MSQQFAVVAYHTNDDIYNERAQNLILSMKRLGIVHDVMVISTLGTWQKNTHYKSIFLKEMLEKHYPLPILYVDVDATFDRYPILFDTLVADIAIYVLDHHVRHPERKRNEMISSTIFLGNTERSMVIIETWIQECQRQPQIWDQKILQQVLNGQSFHLLPHEYCVIFDDVIQPAKPVIVQHQASREFRRLYPNKVH